MATASSAQPRVKLDPDLLAAGDNFLKQCGLNKQNAKQLGAQLMSAAQLATLDLPKQLNLGRYCGGYFIPYPGTKHFRVRLFPKPSGWDKVVIERKPLRYVQATGSTVEAYLPSLVDWADVREDVNQPLNITEGEIKAAKATAEGFLTIGLGGVWCFRSAKRNLALLPALEAFKWEKRRVNICFDSDISTNSDVIAAANALAHQLTALGADVYLVYLPALSHLSKTGLDDFLVAKGAAAFTALLANARHCEPWSECKALHALNEEVIYVKSPATGIIVRLEDAEIMTYRDFVGHAYATRTHTVTHVDGDKVKHELKRTARTWLEWPHRRVAQRLVYAPGEGQFTDAGEYNVWRGMGCEPQPGDVSLWQELLDRLFMNAAAERRYFEQWLAYPLQHPGTKLHTAVVVWGEHPGTGKSAVGHTMQRIYGSNFADIGEADLDKDFNTWARNKQFVLGDEIASSTTRKRDLAERLKAMITRPEVTINEKYKPAYTVKDTINYYFTSNHADAFFLQDDDRRYFVHHVQAKPKEQKFYTRYFDWLKNGNGAAALYDYLLQPDLIKGFEPKGHAPLTAAKREMIEEGRSDLEAWVRNLRENPESILNCDATLWTSKELLTMYDPKKRTGTKEQGLGKHLRRHFAQWGKRKSGVMPVRAVGKSPSGTRLWIISSNSDEVSRLEQLSEKDIAAEYTKHDVDRTNALSKAGI